MIVSWRVRKCRIHTQFAPENRQNRITPFFYFFRRHHHVTPIDALWLVNTAGVVCKSRLAAIIPRYHRNIALMYIFEEVGATTVVGVIDIPTISLWFTSQVIWDHYIAAEEGNIAISQPRDLFRTQENDPCLYRCNTAFICLKPWFTSHKYNTDLYFQRRSGTVLNLTAVSRGTY